MSTKIISDKFGNMKKISDSVDNKIENKKNISTRNSGTDLIIGASINKNRFNKKPEKTLT